MIRTAILLLLLTCVGAHGNCRATAETAASLLAEGSAALDPSRAYSEVSGAYGMLTTSYNECKGDFQFAVLYFKAVDEYASRALRNQAVGAAKAGIERGEALIKAIGSSKLKRAERDRRIAKLKNLIDKLRAYTQQ